MPDEDRTTILVSQPTRKDVKKRAAEMDCTYETFIRRLMEENSGEVLFANKDLVRRVENLKDEVEMEEAEIVEEAISMFEKSLNQEEG